MSHQGEDNMPEFTQSWAFAFIIGCFVGGCFGFLGAAILAASGKASRMEEKTEDKMKFEIATQGKPEDD